MWYVIRTQTGREQELTECIERVLKGNGYRACFVIEQECVWRNAGEFLALPETALSILCHRGHRYAGEILSGVKAGPEAFQTPADGL